MTDSVENSKDKKAADCNALHYHRQRVPGSVDEKAEIEAMEEPQCAIKVEVEEDYIPRGSIDPQTLPRNMRARMRAEVELKEQSHDQKQEELEGANRCSRPWQEKKRKNKKKKKRDREKKSIYETYADGRRAPCKLSRERVKHRSVLIYEEGQGWDGMLRYDPTCSEM